MLKVESYVNVLRDGKNIVDELYIENDKSAIYDMITENVDIDNKQNHNI